MPVRFVFTLALSLAAAAPIAAQQVDTLVVAPGSRLRVVTRAEMRRPTGLFARQTPDSLVLSLECGSCGTSTSTVAWRDVQTVDAQLGRRHGWKSMLVGAGIGLVAGTVIGAIGAKSSINDCQRQGGDFCGLSALAVPIIGTIGAAGGAIVGVAVGTKRWVRVWPNTPDR